MKYAIPKNGIQRALDLYAAHPDTRDAYKALKSMDNEDMVNVTSENATDLERHHYEMIAALAAERPPRIGRTECLDVHGLIDLARHMEKVANAFDAYAMEVIREFGANSKYVFNREEEQREISSALQNLIGIMLFEIERWRE